MTKQTSLSRCGWANNPDKQFYIDYHDHEWGVPVHDDRLLFEMLILEGAQAGLSWETVLKKRDGYRKAFHNFDVQKVSRMTDAQLEKLMQNDGIIKNRLKILSARRNALAFIEIQKEFGSFDHYIWGFVQHTPILNRWTSLSQVPTSTPLSDAISKDLKKRGLNFVGSTIIYAYLQAIGVVNDHMTTCFCHPANA
jgi:DNA-3-methyladenine glycosylase I